MIITATSMLIAEHSRIMAAVPAQRQTTATATWTAAPVSTAALGTRFPRLPGHE